MSYPIPRFVAAVSDEFERARVLFPGQEEALSLHEWFAVITEEIGEVARELNEAMLGNRTDAVLLVNLQTELVQVAAMCGRMFAAVLVVESLGRRLADANPGTVKCPT